MIEKIQKTDVCGICNRLTFGFTAWTRSCLICTACSCKMLTPKVHYKRTGLINLRYRQEILTKLLKG